MPVLPPSPSDFTATVKSAAFINAVIGRTSSRPSKNSVSIGSLGALGAIVTQSVTARASISQRFDSTVVSTVPASEVVAEPPVVSSITTGDTTGSADALIIRYNIEGGLQWVRRIAGVSSDQTVSVASDSSNNVYAFGYCLGPATVFAADGTTVAFSFTAADEFVRTSFIVKYNSIGRPLWLARVVPASPSSIVSDSNGNTYVTGFFFGTPSVIDASGSQTTISSFALSDAFVIKYNTSGIPQWIRRIGNAGSQRGLGINVDSSGNVYVSGFYESDSLTVIAANGTDNALTLPTPTSSDAFIVKYDADGTPLWTRRIGGAGADSGVSIAVNSSGVYVAGTIGNTASVFAADGTSESIALGNSGGSDAFVVKYAADGGPQWARRIAGGGSDTGTGITVDSTGVYIIGNYSGTAAALNSQGNTAISLPFGPNGSFIVNYDNAGDAKWARAIIGSSTVGGKSISSNSSEIYVTGSYRATISVLDSTNSEAFPLTNSGNLDGFVVRYKADGTPEWVRKISGAGFDEGLGITSTASAVYVAGYTEGAATITSTT